MSLLLHSSFYFQLKPGLGINFAPMWTVTLVTSPPLSGYLLWSSLSELPPQPHSLFPGFCEEANEVPPVLSIAAPPLAPHSLLAKFL